MWWGYLHINGSIQVKRFFDQLDIDDAEKSPFVEKITSVFEASNRDEAIRIAKQSLGL